MSNDKVAATFHDGRRRFGTGVYYWTLNRVAILGDWMTRHETDPIDDTPGQRMGATWVARRNQDIDE